MSKQVVATMAGVVLSVAVQPGDTVAAGDAVALLESMKMEIPILAEDGGIVKVVATAPGTVVDDGTVILTFE